MLLDLRDAAGRVPSALVEHSPAVLLRDLAAGYLQVKSPLKGLYLRSFGLAAVARHLAATEGAAAFLVDAFRQLVALWVRVNGDRAALVGMVAEPVRLLAAAGLLDAAAADVLQVLVASDDELAQTVLLRTAMPHLPGLPALLEAVGRCRFGLAASLAAALDAHPAGPEAVPAAWAALRPVLEQHRASIASEAALVAIVRPLLAAAKLGAAPAPLDALVAYLDAAVTDRAATAWAALLHELASTAPAATLAGCPAVLRAVRRDAECSALLLRRMLADRLLGPCAELAAAVFAQDAVDYGRGAIEAAMATLETAALDAPQAAELVRAAVDAPPDDLSACFFVARLADRLDTRLLERHRDATRGAVQLAAGSELRLVFGPDAPAYQFVDAMAARARAASSPADVYEALSKAVLTVERGFADPSVTTLAVGRLAAALRACALPPEDAEGLVRSLARTAHRQLDVQCRAEALLGLLAIVPAALAELAADVLAKALHAVQLAKHGTPHVLQLMPLAAARFEADPAACTALAHPLNELFWEARQLAPDRMEYNRLWDRWQAAVGDGWDDDPPADVDANVDADADEDVDVGADGNVDPPPVVARSDPAPVLAAALQHLDLDPDAHW